MSGLREDETWHTSRGTIRRLSPTSSRMTQSFASESSPVSLEILSRGLFSPVFKKVLEGGGRFSFLLLAFITATGNITARKKPH